MSKRTPTTEREPKKRQARAMAGRLACVGLTLLLCACGADDAPSTADGGLNDGGREDAGRHDGGRVDAGAGDSGQVDASAGDGGVDAAIVQDAGELADAATSTDAGNVPRPEGLCTTAGWCWQHPLPLGSRLDAVHSVNDSENDVWAVGAGATILHWDGVRWSLMPHPDGPGRYATTDWRAVWAASADDVWIVGGPSYGLHWNGSQLDVVDLAPGGWLGLWGLSSSDVWITGGYRVAHYDGVDWSRVPMPDDPRIPELHDISGTSATDIWVVGDNDTVLHWSGTEFTKLTVPRALGPGPFQSVWAATPDDAWALPANTLAARLRWDGVSWQAVSSPSFTVYDIDGRSASDVWAVGVSGNASHWDGMRWTSHRAPYNYALRGIDIDSGWAVGNAGMLARFRDGAWSRHQAVACGNCRLTDIWAASRDDAWAVGGTTLLHWDGIEWSAQEPLAPLRLTAIHGSAANDVWACGIDGALAHWNGSTWTAVATPTSEHLEAIWVLSPSDAWAVGNETTLHWDGDAWQTVAQPVADIGLEDLWASSPTDVWAVSRVGTEHAIHWDGSSWTAVEFAPSATAVWGASANEVYVVTPQGVLHRYDGAWHTMPRLLANPEVLWGTSGSDLYAGDTLGGLWHFDGVEWTDLDTGTAGDYLEGITGADGRVWAAGAGNAIVVKN